MPYRIQPFVNDEIYHVVLRALDDNLIFKDIDDYFRGIFCIYEFNTTQLVKIRERRIIRAQIKKAAQLSTDPTGVTDSRDKLVDILAFCFMPNHIHLILKQLKEWGISKFMQKVGTGLGSYINRKYGRKGYVFQSRFKDVHIKDDDQLRTSFVYVHTNPTALIEPDWKERGVKDPERVIKFLKEEYRWSSFFDYIGKKNFSSVTDRDFFLEIMGGPQGCMEAVEHWIQYKGEINKEFVNLAIE